MGKPKVSSARKPAVHNSHYSVSYKKAGAVGDDSSIMNLSETVAYPRQQDSREGELQLASNSYR